MTVTKVDVIKVNELPRKERELLWAGRAPGLLKNNTIDDLAIAVENDSSPKAKNRVRQTIGRVRKRGIWPLGGDGQPEGGAVRLDWGDGNDDGGTASAKPAGHAGNGDVTATTTNRNPGTRERFFRITTPAPNDYVDLGAKPTDEDQFIRDVLSGFAALPESAQPRVWTYLRDRLNEIVVQSMEF